MNKLTFIIEKAEESDFSARVEPESILHWQVCLKNWTSSSLMQLSAVFDGAVLPRFKLKFVN